MSGGYFEYAQYRIGEIYDSIERLISNNNDKTLDEWGSPKGYGYGEETIQALKQAVIILRLAQIYAHRVDWLASGDDGEDSFHERLANDISDLLPGLEERNAVVSALLYGAAPLKADEPSATALGKDALDVLKHGYLTEEINPLVKQGCRVCGIGADGKAYGYACIRGDCPTRVTYTVV